jgi:ABC-type branched-subunit amino acid transport system substrate-binding protein
MLKHKMLKHNGVWPLLMGLVALLALAAIACNGDDGGTSGTQTPSATGTAAATGTPSATGTAAPTAAPTTPPESLIGVSSPEDDKPNVGLPKGKIVLGSHFAQSGTYGAAFKPVGVGLKAYFEHVNKEKGGVCGRQIEFHPEDDYYEPAKAQEVTRKLVEHDHIFAMIAGLGTAAHSAVWDYLNQKGIPDLWLMTGAHKWTTDPHGHPWTVPLLPDYTVEGTIQAKIISERFPGKKVTILYQNDDFGKDGYAGLRQGLDPSKNELVGPQSYESNAVSVTSQVANMAQTKAEVAVCACIPGYTAQAIQHANALGWKPQWFVDYVNSDPLLFTYILPKEVEGTFSLQANKLIQDTNDPAIQEHIRIMNKYGASDVVPANFSIVGQVAGMLTEEVLHRACDSGTLSRQSLMDAVESLRDFYPSDPKNQLALPGVLTTITDDDHIATEAMRLLVAKIDANGLGVWEYEGDLIPFK